MVLEKEDLISRWVSTFLASVTGSTKKQKVNLLDVMQLGVIT